MECCKGHNIICIAFDNDGFLTITDHINCNKRQIWWKNFALCNQIQKQRLEQNHSYSGCDGDVCWKY